MSSKVIYEVECQLDPDIVADYDAWLPGHVREVLACAGFEDASIEAPEFRPGERHRRRVRYRVESAAALENYLENEATRLRTATAERFGGKIHCDRRVFQPQAELTAAAAEPRRCLDCGAPVTGKHCQQCGQAGDLHVLSVREVAGDVTHSLIHLDSRVWRTLKLLVRRPGELTREFIAGRHQRYLPPFRLYLGVSILFFGLTALLPDSSPVKVDPSAQMTKELREDLAKEGVDEAKLEELEKSPCSGLDIDATLPIVGSIREPAREACERIRADRGKRLAERFLATAPKLMFLFLPLMAAIALLFYWRPRRLYAEHLVLFLHNHAFTFLLLLVVGVLDALMTLPVPFIGVLGLLSFLLFLYLPWYVFRSMRVVYGQRRVATSLKFTALSLIYFLLLGITMFIAFVWSALT